jgi:hypothetical protein
MPVRSAPSIAVRPAYGFAQRLYVSTNLRPIVNLLAVGLSPSEAAAGYELAWPSGIERFVLEAASVARLIALDNQIRMSDACSGRATQDRTAAWPADKRGMWTEADRREHGETRAAAVDVAVDH